MLNISMDFLYINIINFGGIYSMIDKVMKETIIEKEIMIQKKSVMQLQVTKIT